MDETTDVTITSSQCVIVRYADKKKGLMVETLWELGEVYENKDSVVSDQALTDMIVKSFEDEKIP